MSALIDWWASLSVGMQVGIGVGVLLLVLMGMWGAVAWRIRGLMVQEEKDPLRRDRRRLRARLEKAVREPEPVQAKPRAKPKVSRGRTPPRLPLEPEHILAEPPRQFFAGRVQLLNSWRRKLIRRPKVVQVVGGAGSGKSALAAHLFHGAGDKYGAEGKYWLDLRGQNLTYVVRRFLRALQVDAEKWPDGISGLCGLVHQQLQGRRILLVLDGVDAFASDDSGWRELSHLIPPSPAMTLMTTRQAFDEIPIIPLVALEEPALAFLSRSLQWKVKEVASQRVVGRQLVKKLNYLPQSIEITAKRMTRETPFQSSAHALALLEAEVGERDASLIDTFTLSFRQLPPTTQRLFRALAVCAPTGTPVAALIHIAKIPFIPLAKALQMLADYAFIIYDAKRGYVTQYSTLHAHAQQLAQEEPTSFQQFKARHATYFKERIFEGVSPAAREVIVDLEAENIALSR